MSMRVAMLAAECEPWAKTGGLADVVDALARALGAVGSADVEPPVDVFLPRYRTVAPPPSVTRTVVHVPDPVARGSIEVELLEAETHGYRLHLVDHPPAFDRDGFYGDAGGDYVDNAWRFGLFCRAALERLRGTGVDVLHLHDWHAGPAALQRDGPLRDDAAIGRAAIVVTVHNLAYHGWTPAKRAWELGAGPDALPRGADGIDLLREAIRRSELVNTVSPGFAAEALGPEQGMGLDDALRAKGDRFSGILNGLDTELWDPGMDPALAAPYFRSDRSGKAACRRALLGELGMDAADPGPVLAMIGRLDPQKGFDLLAEAASTLLARGLRLVVLGSGHAALVEPLRRLAAVNAGRIALLERFDRQLARRIYAGADGFLMPSRFEPCGTGQMVALRYGTPPIVRATGGLRDTVVDETANPGRGTGFAFGPAEPAGLVDACERFAAAFAPGEPAWEALLDRGMAVDFDWRSSSAPAYVALYRRAVELRAAALQEGVTGHRP